MEHIHALRRLPLHCTQHANGQVRATTGAGDLLCEPLDCLVIASAKVIRHGLDLRGKLAVTQLGHGLELAGERT